MNSYLKIVIADLALFSMNFVWGYSFVLVKNLLTDLPAFYILAVRFLLAFLVFLPFQWNNLRKSSLSNWRFYTLCGTALALGFGLQTLGVERTTPGKAGVITGMLVIFVPVFNKLLRKKSISKLEFFGTTITFIGLSVFSYRPEEIELFQIKLGDTLVFLCAISYALHIVLVDYSYSKAEYIHSGVFVLFQMLVGGLIFAAFSGLLENHPANLTGLQIFSLLFISLGATLLAYNIQMIAQKYAPTSHVGVILSLEAVFAYLFSNWFLGEVFTGPMLIGMTIIVLGTAVTSLQKI